MNDSGVDNELGTRCPRRRQPGTTPYPRSGPSRSCAENSGVLAAASVRLSSSSYLVPRLVSGVRPASSNAGRGNTISPLCQMIESGVTVHKLPGWLGVAVDPLQSDREASNGRLGRSSYRRGGDYWNRAPHRAQSGDGRHFKSARRDRLSLSLQPSSLSGPNSRRKVPGNADTAWPAPRIEKSLNQR